MRVSRKIENLCFSPNECSSHRKLSTITYLNNTVMQYYNAHRENVIFARSDRPVLVRRFKHNTGKWVGSNAEIISNNIIMDTCCLGKLMIMALHWLVLRGNLNNWFMNRDITNKVPNEIKLSSGLLVNTDCKNCVLRWIQKLWLLIFVIPEPVLCVHVLLYFIRNISLLLWTYQCWYLSAHFPN